MTLEEIRQSTKPWLSPKDVAQVLRCCPYTLNVTINTGGTLPFEHIKLGSRLKIARVPFIDYAERMGLG